MSQFYTYDGTWRTSEPSWRVMLGQRENLRGCPSYGMTLNDPAAMNTLQRGRRAQSAPATHSPAKERAQLPANANQEAAAAAAETFLGLNFKDLKLSGFANETQCHTLPHEMDPERWGRLGIMTRERLVGSDRFGDTAVPQTRPVTAPTGLKPCTYPKQSAMPAGNVPPRPGCAEASGFTRRPQLHSAKMLTGGFVYVEPEVPPPPDVASVKVVGNKLPTGFALNNHDDAAEDATGSGATMRPAVTRTHWARTTIGASGNASNWYEGVGARVSKYGEMRRRKLAPHETGGSVNTLRVETSGFTRDKLHQRDHVRTEWTAPGTKELTIERKLQASQIALRQMANPIEFTNPHAHKERKMRR